MTEALVLVPGMMCDHRVFEPQLRAFGSERAITVAPIAGGDRIETIAAGLVDQLPQRFALAGLSMGGIVAMEIIRRIPERVTRLCLMSTESRSEAPQVAAAREPLIVGARAGRLDEVLGQTMLPDYLAPGARRIKVLERYFAMGRTLGSDVFIRQSRALQRRPDQQGTLRRIAVPTVIICGAHDRMTPVRHHQFMAGLIAGADLKILDGSGHLPVLEQPDATNAILRDWLRAPVAGP